MPTEAEREMAMRRLYSSQETDALAVRNSYQMARLKAAAVVPWAGGEAKANQWMYGTASGYAFQQLAGAAVTHGMLGGGNPLGMSYGIQQMLGRGGVGFNDLSGGGAMGGINRSFGGAGYVTDQFSQQLFKGLQTKFFGERGNRNTVSGLNMDQVGELMAAMGDRRAFAGQQVGSFENAGVAERIKQFRAMADPRLAGKLAGVTTQKGLDELISRTEKSGDIETSNAFKALSNSRQIFKGSKKFEEDTEKLIKSTAEMVTTLGNIMGSDDMPKMLRMAEQFAGKAIRTVGDANRVKGQVDQAVSFAESHGVSGQSYLQEVIAQGTGVQSMMAQKYGIDPALSGSMAAAIARMAGRNGLIAYGNQGAGPLFSSGEAMSLAAVGGMERVMENPELVALADAIRSGDLSGSEIGEAHGYLKKFRTANTQEARAGVRANINDFFMRKFGQGAFQRMGGTLAGVASAFNMPGVSDLVGDLLSDQLNASIPHEGSMLAYSQLKTEHRAALNQGFAETITNSLTAQSADELARLMQSGGDVRKFLELKSGSLRSTDGKAVSVDTLMAQLGGGDMSLKGAALGAFNMRFRHLPYAKGLAPVEGQQMADAKMFTDMLSRGAGYGQRRGTDPIMTALAKGLLTGADGTLIPEAVLELANQVHPGAVTTLNLKGDRINATAGDLDKILGADRDDYLAQAGMKSTGDLAKTLAASGDAGLAASAHLFRYLGQSGKRFGRVSDSKLMVTDAKTYDDTLQDQTLAASRRPLERLLGLKDKALDDITDPDKLGDRLLTEIGGKGGLLSKANTGDSIALAQIQEANRRSKGALTQSIDTRISQITADLTDAKGSSKDKMTADLKELKKASDQLHSVNQPTMIVTNLTVTGKYIDNSNKEG